MSQKFRPQLTQRQLTQVRGSILFGKWCQDLIDRHLADVHQHIGVREPFHGLGDRLLCLRHETIQRIPAIIFLQHRVVHYRRNPVIVKFEPPGFQIWPDESKVAAALIVTGVNEDTVKFVLPGFGPVSRLVEEFVEVNFKWVFEAIADL